MQNKNRDYMVPKPDEIVFAECPHCDEPLTYTIHQSPQGFDARCYCRGADGLGFIIRCCIELKCDIKKGNYCDLKPKSKDIYDFKTWNSIVIEPTKMNDD